MSLKKLIEGWSMYFIYLIINYFYFYFFIIAYWLYVLVGGQNVLLDYPSTSGFIDYVYKEIIPICFIVPLQPTFDLNEGQAYLVRK